MKKTKRSFLLPKWLFLLLSSSMYFIEFILYYILIEPVDPGYIPNPIGDLINLLALCLIKTFSVLFYMFKFRKLNQKGIGVNIYIILVTILSTLVYLPVVSFNYSKNELIGIFTPIIANLLIIIVLGIYLLKEMCKLIKNNENKA